MGGMSNLSSVSRLVDNRDIYQNQKRQNYFKPSSYFLATVMVEWPLQMLDSILITVVSYFLIDLSGKEWAFFVFVLCYFMINLCGREMCMLCAGMIESKVLASSGASIVMNILLLSAGFALPTKSFPKPWIWLHYLSIFKYPWEAMCISQIKGETFYCEEDELVPPESFPLLNVPYPVGYSGSQTCPITTDNDLLDEFDVPTNEYMIGVDFAISVFYYVVLLFLNYLVARHKVVDSVVNARVENIVRAIHLQKEIIQKGRGLANVNAVAVDIESDFESTVAKELPIAETYSFQDMNYDVIVPRGPETESEPIVSFEELNIKYPKISTSSKKKGVRRLLYGINGKSKPGYLIALMGPSGAGKTTLLDALSGRIRSPSLFGEVSINGESFSVKHMRMLGYVEQTNKQAATDTVRESLLFSAYLRLPEDVSKEEKVNVVNRILGELNLEDVAESTISSLTDEQRKRVTLGTELAAMTSIVFVDEPTTGLDTFSATAVMQFIRKVADAGRIVICTIHQPSRKVFLAI